MVNGIKDYFSHTHLDFAFKGSAPLSSQLPPHYNFKYDYIFLPQNTQNIPTLHRQLILNHEYHHAADMHNVFFLLLHYLNEIIANFNYFVGTYLERPFDGEMYIPPINKLSEDEWVHMEMMTEGLPLFTRFTRYQNYINAREEFYLKHSDKSARKLFSLSGEDEELWLLQKSILSKKSIYDYGVGFYSHIYLQNADTVLKTDVGSFEPQTLLNNVLGKSYYDNILQNLRSININQHLGFFINFITPPSYKEIVSKIMQIGEEDIYMLYSFEYFNEIQSKIVSITDALFNIMRGFKNSFLHLSQDNRFTFKGIEVLDYYFLPILEHEKKIQELTLNSFINKRFDDVIIIRYLLQNTVSQFHQVSPYLRHRNVKDVMQDNVCQIHCKEIKNEILNLELDDYRSKQLFLNMILTSVRFYYNKSYIDCPLRCIYDGISNFESRNICEEMTFLLENIELKISPSADYCRFNKNDSQENINNCFFFKVLKSIV